MEVTPGEIRVEGENRDHAGERQDPAAETSGYILPKLKAKLTGKSATRHQRSRRHALRHAGARDRYGVWSRRPRGVLPSSQAQHDQGHGLAHHRARATSPRTRITGSSADTDLLPWESFTKVWDESLNACQSSSRADCGYAPLAKAEGGKLDMMLRVRGSGLALRMRQTGAPEAADKPAEKPKKPKAEMLDGVKAAPQAAPSARPSPPASTCSRCAPIRPRRCPRLSAASPSPSVAARPVAVVFDAEGISLTVHVLSLLGAAFPDGTPAPNVAWVLPPR
ncbi:MAG: hypothetical protein QM769_11210 [Pseudoxanthomonas sp.]